MKTTLKVNGMTCAMCVKTIEMALAGLEGVKAAKANLNSETVFVDFDESKVSINQIIRAIEDVGYEVIRERRDAVIKIGGMTCAMCVKTVENAIRELPGVLDVSVNLATESARVSYNPALVTIEDIKGAVEGVGYEFLGVEGRKATT